MGLERFTEWCSMLPHGSTTIGLDEHTGLVIDFEKEICEVSGVSSVSLVRECDPEIFASGAKFPLSRLGDFHRPEDLSEGISAQAWEMVTQAPPLQSDQPPAEVLALLEQRAAAREKKDFAESDRLREEILALGWQVQDSREGQKLARG
jgi:hypothetical protein